MKKLQDELQRMLQKKGGSEQSYRTLMNAAFTDPDVQRFIHDHSISKEAVRHSATKIYEFVQQKQRDQTHQRHLIPGYQPQLVYDGRLIDVIYVPTPETLQQRQRQTLKNRIHSIAMPKQVQHANFDAFNFDENHSRLTILNAAIDFVQKYKQHSAAFVPGLYLSGSFGVGKTYTLGAIANELAKNGISTTMVHFPSFVVEMKNSISDHTAPQKIDAVKKAPILMIDDIGADVMSDWIRDEVLGVILEYRMQNELPTFFSSNLSMTSLEERHLPYDKKNREDNLRAQRIMQRIRFLAREYQLTGTNLRLKEP